MLFDKMPDSTVLRVRSDKSKGSWIEAFDVEEERKSDHVKRFESMARYLIKILARPQRPCKVISVCCSRLFLRPSTIEPCERT